MEVQPLLRCRRRSGRLRARRLRSPPRREKRRRHRTTNRCRSGSLRRGRLPGVRCGGPLVRDLRLRATGSRHRERRRQRDRRTEVAGGRSTPKSSTRGRGPNVDVRRRRRAILCLSNNGHKCVGCVTILRPGFVVCNFSAIDLSRLKRILICVNRAHSAKEKANTDECMLTNVSRLSRSRLSNADERARLPQSSFSRRPLRCTTTRVATKRLSLSYVACCKKARCHCDLSPGLLTKSTISVRKWLAC